MHTADVMARKTMQKQRYRAREALHVGSQVEVFSESLKRFVPGTVSRVTEEDSGRWLTVHYGSKRQREMQRFSDYIRIPKKHRRKSKKKDKTSTSAAKSNIERVLSKESGHRKSRHNLHIMQQEDTDKDTDADTTLNQTPQKKASEVDVEVGRESGQQEEAQERDEIKVSNQEQDRPIPVDPTAFPEPSAGVKIGVGDWMDMVKTEWGKAQALLNQQQCEANQHIQKLKNAIEDRDIEIEHLNTCNDKLADGMKEVLDMLSDKPCMTESVVKDDVQKEEAQERDEQIEEINAFLEKIKNTLVRQRDTIEAQQNEIKKLLLCRHTTKEIFKKLTVIGGLT